MTAKGFDNGNDAADRLMEWLRDARFFEPRELTAVRNRVTAIRRAERNRTIASLRGRWARRQQTHGSQMEDVGKVAAQIVLLLDEMEQES